MLKPDTPSGLDICERVATILRFRALERRAARLVLVHGGLVITDARSTELGDQGGISARSMGVSPASLGFFRESWQQWARGATGATHDMLMTATRCEVAVTRVVVNCLDRCTLGEEQLDDVTMAAGRSVVQRGGVVLVASDHRRAALQALLHNREPSPKAADVQCSVSIFALLVDGDASGVERLGHPRDITRLGAGQYRSHLQLLGRRLIRGRQELVHHRIRVGHCACGRATCVCSALCGVKAAPRSHTSHRERPGEAGTFANTRSPHRSCFSFHAQIARAQ